MKLFLCEKPSQGNDIAKVLKATKRADGCIFTADQQICVTWGVGHLVEQFQPEEYDPALKRWSFETLPIIPAQWKLSPKKETKKQYSKVMSLIKKASTVIISTDADREGEMIARELLDLAGFKGQVLRLWLSALDEESIRKALSTLKSGKETESLYYAGIGRSRSDWLIGMNFSRLFTLLAQQQGYQGPPLSVGRVQSPTLAMVVKRDREIANFVPKSHFALIVQLQTQQGQQLLAKYIVPENYLDSDGLCLNEKLIQQVSLDIQRVGTATVKEIETKREKNAPPLLFALSDLQSECNRLFGMGTQQVLDIAQALYEKHKATTYPRTDCGYLPESQFAEVPKVIASMTKANPNWQKIVPHLNLSQKSRAWNDKKMTAHHGIIPTMGNVNIGAMDEQELKVYDLICRRYLAQFLPHFEIDKTVALLQCGQHDLIAKGNVVIARGWKALFGTMDTENDDEDNQGLPPLALKQVCQITASEVKSLKTTPPSHYTEGTLLSAMKNAARFVTDERLKQRLRETEGLGTEATRASLIQGLIDRGFLNKKGKQILATEQANALIDSLPDLLKDPELTALWEQALNQIAEGSMNLSEFMQKQENFIRMLMNNCIKQGMSLGKIEVKKCSQCGKPMRKINHAKGTFWGCTGYPECQHKEASTRRKSSAPTKTRSNVNISEQISKLRSQL